MPTADPPPDPKTIQMVMGWVDNYLANTRKMVPPLNAGFGEWMKKNCPKVQTLENFNAVGKVLGGLLDKNLDFKIHGRTATNDLPKFNMVWDTWEKVITSRIGLMETEARATGDMNMFALTRCLTLVTQLVHDEPKDGKQLPKVLAEWMTKLYEEIKKALPKK